MYFEIDELPLKPKGEVEVEMTFEIKPDGLLHVYSQLIKPSLGEKKEQISKISPGIYNVNEEEIKRRSKVLQSFFQMSYE